MNKYSTMDMRGRGRPRYSRSGDRRYIHGTRRVCNPEDKTSPQDYRNVGVAVSD